ncbi:MAG: DUF2269 family protein [Actinobacteria bacterium]|nr:MAG: DUF2269 family protein [Actinomycetota bacterium]
MEQAVAAPSAANRRRTSIIVTASIAVALVAVSIVFAASAPWYYVFKMLHVGAAVVWVGGGLFITILAVLAELANDDDQLLQIGHWAETVAGRLFPVMSFVVLGFGIAMTMNGDIPYNQFWIIFGLVAWALSAATGIAFLGPESKRLNKAAAEHGPKAPEVQARLRRILFVVRVDVALMFLIVFDMVVKPFSWS